MPGLPYAQLPGGTQYRQATMRFTPNVQTGPFDIIQDRKNQLWETYSNLERDLRNTPMVDQEFTKQVNTLQQSYAAEFEQLRKTEAQMQMVQEMMDRGQLSPQAGMEAMTRMALPPEISRAIPRGQTGKPDTPMSVASLTAPRFTETIGEFAEEARVKSFWKPKRFERFDKDKLIKQYLAWREFTGYDNLAPVRQRQMDIAWDDEMYVIGAEEWDPKSPNIKQLRAYGRLQRAAASRQNGQRPPSTLSEDIVNRLRLQQPAQDTRPKQKQLDRDTAMAILKETGGDKEKARQIAKDRGYKL